MKITIINLLLSYLTTICLGLVTNGITGIDIILPLVFAFSFVIYKRAYTLFNKKDIIYIIISSIIPALSVMSGNHIKMYDIPRRIEPFKITDVFTVVVLTVFFGAVIINIYDFIDGFGSRKNHYDNESNSIILKISKIKNPFVWGSILFVCYLPYYLAFFPGNWGKDSFESYSMALGEMAITNHQPVLFTFFMKMVVVPVNALAGTEMALAAFSLVHMCIFAFGCGYFLSWLSKKNTNKYLFLAAVLLFCFHPFMGMYSIYITKDVLFSVLLVLLVIRLIDIEDIKTTGDIIVLFGNILLLMLLRNNGIYIAFILTVALIIIKKILRKKLIIATGTIVFLYLLVKGPVFRVMNIAPESIAEALSIPLQQIAYVIVNHPEEIPENEALYLESILPFEEVNNCFTLGYTDTYKFNPDFNDKYLNETKREFFGVYMKLLTLYPIDYIEAYLAQTCGYWHYGETNTVATEGVVENQYGIVNQDLIKKITGVPISAIIEKAMLFMRKAPVFCIVSSMAAEIYVIFFLAVLHIRRGEAKRLIPLMPIIVLWGSLMVAVPAYCLFRYMFSAFLAWPITIREFMYTENR